MGWDNRSLVIFILLAILITFPIAYRIGRWEAVREMKMEVIPLYQKEINRLEKWNDELKQGLRPLSPFPYPKKGGS